MDAIILFSSALQYVFGILLTTAALFLILLVLVQRGRGGGLTGALGGMGGQSAFGARAGDTFTYITIWAAAIWIILCIAAVKFMAAPTGQLGREEDPMAGQSQQSTGPLDGSSMTPVDGGGEIPTTPSSDRAATGEGENTPSNQNTEAPNPPAGEPNPTTD